MNFDDPTEFEAARDVILRKGLMPTSGSSAAIRDLQQTIKLRAFFSATMTDAGALDLAQKLTAKIAGGPNAADFAARAAGKTPLLVSIPEAKAQILEYLQAQGYQPSEEDRGTIKDLTSDARRQLIVETNVLDAQGYGRWLGTQNEMSLYGNPAWELVRMRFSKVPRDWEQRWTDARDATEEEGSTEAGERMVALKNHPIWQALGDGIGGYEDTLGNAWPPFAFNSGMTVIDVNRDDALALGIMDQETKIEPQEDPGGLDNSLEGSVAGYAEFITDALRLVKGLRVKDDVATLKNTAPANGSRYAVLRNRLNGIIEVLANSGTSEGAQKGWETRRGGMAARAAIGKTGDWKSLGLRETRNLPVSAKRPARMSREDAMAKLATPYHKVDPVGNRVEFGERVREHLDAHPHEARPEWLPHAETAVEHPAEVWQDGNRLRHIAVFKSASGRKTFLVASHQVGETESKVVTFTPKNFRGVEKSRTGTLLHAI